MSKADLLHRGTIETDWDHHRKHFGPGWDGWKVRWNVELILKMDQYISGAIRAYEEWYDHPYTMVETWDDQDEERVYAGGTSVQIKGMPDADVFHISDVLADLGEDRTPRNTQHQEGALANVVKAGQ